jgi:hypothetical protein
VALSGLRAAIAVLLHQQLDPGLDAVDINGSLGLAAAAAAAAAAAPGQCTTTRSCHRSLLPLQLVIILLLITHVLAITSRRPFALRLARSAVCATMIVAVVVTTATAAALGACCVGTALRQPVHRSTRPIHADIRWRGHHRVPRNIEVTEPRQLRHRHGQCRDLAVAQIESAQLEARPEIGRDGRDGVVGGSQPAQRRERAKPGPNLVQPVKGYIKGLEPSEERHDRGYLDKTVPRKGQVLERLQMRKTAGQASQLVPRQVQVCQVQQSRHGRRQGSEQQRGQACTWTRKAGESGGEV